QPDELAPHLELALADVLAGRGEPGFELGAAAQVEPWGKLAAQAAGGLERGEVVAGRGGDQADVVAVAAVELEANGLAVGDEARGAVVVDRLAQLAEAPAQRALGIVGHVPEQRAERLAAV